MAYSLFFISYTLKGQSAHDSVDLLKGVYIYGTPWIF